MNRDGQMYFFQKRYEYVYPAMCICKASKTDAFGDINNIECFAYACQKLNITSKY